jgi:membrane fusion protein (multidrug efflux system)
MHLRRWFITVLVCISVFAGLGFIKFTQVKAAIAFGESFPEPSETVHAIEATPNSWQPSLKVTGEVVPTRSIDIRNELEGVITKVGFKSGGIVEQGDILVQLDISNELAQLEAIKAEIQIANLDVNRFGELLKSRASSKDQYDRAKAQLAVAEAREKELRATIAKKTLKAPFSGKAGLHRLEVGSFLPASTVITRVNGLANEVWIDFQVPQEYAYLSEGTQITVTSASQLSGEASVIALAQEISTTSRNMMVRAEMGFDEDTQNKQVHFKPGSLVSIDIPIEQVESVIILPTLAIRYDAFGTYVYTLNKDDSGSYRATRKPIETITQENNQTVVKSGLTYGDLIATMGSYKLREGMLVNIAENTSLNAARVSQQ